jgi:hypothetical protein
MARLGEGVKLTLAAVLALGMAGGAAAQQPNSGIAVESSPFVTPPPGQDQGNVAPRTPLGLTLGLLHWHPIASRCNFVDASADKDSAAADEPWPLVFVTMAETGGSAATGLERGYVMANGLVRELEKGKTAADKDGSVVTVWRSAGEPRINVNVNLREARGIGEDARYFGSMTVFWSDKRETVAIAGECRN